LRIAQPRHFVMLIAGPSREPMPSLGGYERARGRFMAQKLIYAKLPDKSV
jgi:hypothetical protein